MCPGTRPGPRIGCAGKVPDPTCCAAHRAALRNLLPHNPITADTGAVTRGRCCPHTWREAVQWQSTWIRYWWRCVAVMSGWRCVTGRGALRHRVMRRRGLWRRGWSRCWQSPLPRHLLPARHHRTMPLHTPQPALAIDGVGFFGCAQGGAGWRDQGWLAGCQGVSGACRRWWRRQWLAVALDARGQAQEGGAQQQSRDSHGSPR